MNKVEKETLYELYVIRGKPMHEISEELDIAIGTVYNYLVKYGIPRKNKKESFTMKGRKLTKEQCMAISRRNTGKVLSKETKQKISESNKKGGIGHKKKRRDGYIAVYFPDHPKSNKDGYVMEHVLVAECLAGRHINENEVVHHINEKRDDNRRENLKIMTKSEHMSYHSAKRHMKKKGGMTYQ